MRNSNVCFRLTVLPVVAVHSVLSAGFWNSSRSHNLTARFGALPVSRELDLLRSLDKKALYFLKHVTSWYFDSELMTVIEQCWISSCSRAKTLYMKRGLWVLQYIKMFLFFL